MIGEVVGSYRLLRKLGSGGMGDVWAGEHLLLGQRVAIKFLPPRSAATRRSKRFFDEARAAARIADRNRRGSTSAGTSAAS
jgi:serine/threonine-protein kinase